MGPGGTGTVDVLEGTDAGADPLDAVRSPVDVVRLVTATIVLLAVLVVARWFGATLTAFAAELLAGLSALPAWLVGVVVTGSRVLAAVLLGAGAVAVVRAGRWRPVLPVAVAAVVAGALMATVSLDALGVAGPPPGSAALDTGSVPVAGFPSTPGLAALAAGATAAAPWLGRGWRRATWATLLGLAVARFLAVPASFATPAALLVGWLVGAAAVVAFGGPSRRPRAGAVAAGLGTAGVALVRLERAGVDARGSTPYFGEDVGGARVFVKALGDDERSADRLFRLYRRLTPRDLGDERPFTTLRRAVEHEALVTLACHGVAVRTPRLVAVARAEPHGFVLAYEAVDGRSLDRVAPAEVTDDVLAQTWSQVERLRAHRTAHRDLRLANVFLDVEGRVWLVDFGFGELAASDLQLATDVAELVASSALLVGAARAVDAAAAGVGPGPLGAARGRLRPWALSGATRRGLRSRSGLLDDLHRRIGRLCDPR